MRPKFYAGHTQGFFEHGCVTILAQDTATSTVPKHLFLSSGILDFWERFVGRFLSLKKWKKNVCCGHLGETISQMGVF